MPSHHRLALIRHYPRAPQLICRHIDEAFMSLDADGSKSFYERGTNIREKVLKWTGIPVSVGIGQTKTLAKVANQLAKKDAAQQGVLDLTPINVQTEALERAPVQEVWGIGHAYSKLLKAAA